GLRVRIPIAKLASYTHGALGCPIRYDVIVASSHEQTNRPNGTTMPGSQHAPEDPCNATILIWINGALVPRASATLSPLDGGFIAGDGVREGTRLINGRLLFLNEHQDLTHC